MKKYQLLKLVSNEDLTRKVLTQIGASFWEIWEHPENYANASGGVSGFIYYNDTEKFADKNMSLIFESLYDFEEEIGEPLKKDRNNLKNWFSWFALENVMHEIINIKENL